MVLLVNSIGKEVGLFSPISGSDEKNMVSLYLKSRCSFKSSPDTDLIT